MSRVWSISTARAGFTENRFRYCRALKGGKGTACDGENHIGGEYARIDGVAGPGYFTGKDAPSFTIRFDGAGASGSMSDMKCELGKVYKLRTNTFTNAGKTFKGWRGDNKKRYDDGVLIFDAADAGQTLVLTAIWK